jgi:hypothetical protein
VSNRQGKLVQRAPLGSSRGSPSGSSRSRGVVGAPLGSSWGVAGMEQERRQGRAGAMPVRSRDITEAEQGRRRGRAGVSSGWSRGNTGAEPGWNLSRSVFTGGGVLRSHRQERIGENRHPTWYMVYQYYPHSKLLKNIIFFHFQKYPHQLWSISTHTTLLSK